MTAAVAPPTRRERKKQATRDAIAIAALELIEERGIGALTVDAIAARADVAPRTFFNYFSSKEGAVVGSDPNRADDLASALLQRPADEPPLVALRHVLTDDLLPRVISAQILRRRIRVIKREPELRAALAAQQDATGRRLAEAMALRTGRPADDPYPALVTTAALSAIKITLLHWCDEGDRPPLPNRIDTTFALLGAGLTGVPARAPVPERSSGAEPLSPSPRRQRSSR